MSGFFLPYLAKYDNFFDVSVTLTHLSPEHVSVHKYVMTTQKRNDVGAFRWNSEVLVASFLMQVMQVMKDGKL